jgi:hypothetical protein
MIKNLTIALLLLFSSIIAQAQTNWINYKVDNKISVKFPSKPTQMSHDILISSNKDSTAEFTMSMIDIAKIAHIDSAGIAKNLGNPDIMKNMADFINEQHRYSKLKDFKIGNWNGFTTYTSMAVGANPRNKYYNILMLFIGTKMYTFEVVLAATADSNIKDDYFSSISLN